jgi:dTDP-4-amino-4,6-dideoxygalactose transaminase
LPNADRVMEEGLVFPSNHALSDADIGYIWETAEAFL